MVKGISSSLEVGSFCCIELEIVLDLHVDHFTGLLLGVFLGFMACDCPGAEINDNDKDTGHEEMMGVNMFTGLLLTHWIVINPNLALVRILELFKFSLFAVQVYHAEVRLYRWISK